MLAPSLVGVLLVIPFIRRSSDDDPAVYRAMFDQAPDARFVLDAQLHILHANTTAAQMFGTVELMLRGVVVTELVAPASRPAFVRALASVHGTPSRSGPVELQGRIADGSLFPIEIDLIHGSEERYGLVVRDLRSRGESRQSSAGRFNPGQTLIASRIGELV